MVGIVPMWVTEAESWSYGRAFLALAVALYINDRLQHMFLDRFGGD